MEVIAEIANSHQGSIKILTKLINELYKKQIKIIKLQVYFADELLVKNHNRYNHFLKQSFTQEEWKKIINYAKKKGFTVYVDIFGLKALKIFKEIDVDGFKIHSSDLCNSKILNIVNKSKKKIFLSCGGANGFEISYALNKLRDVNVTLMHGFQDYPTKFEDINLNRIHWLRKNFLRKNISLGYQDHTKGNDLNNSILISTNAISLGAKYLEKHVTLSRKLKVDSSSSLEPLEFKNYQEKINQFMKTLGSEEFNMSSAEKNYRNIVKKFVVAKKLLKKNIKLKTEDLEFKRVNKNQVIQSSYLEDFIGKKINQNIFQDDVLQQSNVKNNINALIIARLKSKRLKKKSILKINGEYLIQHLINRVKRLDGINKIILCTSNNKNDDKLVEIAKKNKIFFFRGDETNVLKRINSCVKKFKCDHILRITGDDILIDKYYAEKTIKTHLSNNSDYTDCKLIPSGTEIEVFSTKIIKNLSDQLIDSSGTEYLTNYVTDNKDQFSISSCKVKKAHQSKIRLTIDTKEDFKSVKIMLNKFIKQKKFYDYNFDDILKYYSKLKKKHINQNIKHLKKPIKFNTKLSWSLD